MLRRKLRDKGVPVSLTGQEDMPFAQGLEKIRAKGKEIRNKVNEKRPGVVLPKESGLLAPSNISVDHERILPQRDWRSYMSVDY